MEPSLIYIMPNRSTNNSSKCQQKKHQDKSSKQRAQDKFQTRVNEQVYSDHRSQLYGHLARVFNNFLPTPWKRAIPLSVTTRAVGICSTIFYMQAVSACNLGEISEIANIHQVYRVALWLFHYKVHLANQIQVERRTAEVLQRIIIDDETSSILNRVQLIPNVLLIVYNAVGKIETANVIYHSGYSLMPTTPQDALEFRELCVNPENIRETLLMLANPNTPLASRIEYQEYNCIPGANFVDNLLQNADDIYPDGYSVTQLQADVSAFNNLINRVQLRLPNLSSIKWNGKATSSGLWSSPKTRICINSTFDIVARPRTSEPCRDNQGVVVEMPDAPQYNYSHATIRHEPSYFSSREDTPQADIVAGIASLVGEECFLETRYNIHNSVAITGSSVKFLDVISNM